MGLMIMSIDYEMTAMYVDGWCWRYQIILIKFNRMRLLKHMVKHE